MFHAFKAESFKAHNVLQSCMFGLRKGVIMNKERREQVMSGLSQYKLTENDYHVYPKLSQSAMDPRNKSVLKQISDDELKHSNF